MPERYTISLLNNIWNFNCLVAIQVHQDYFLLGLENFRFENTKINLPSEDIVATQPKHNESVSTDSVPILNDSMK